MSLRRKAEGHVIIRPPDHSEPNGKPSAMLVILQGTIDKIGSHTLLRDQDGFLTEKDAQVLCDLIDDALLRVDQRNDERLLLRIPSIFVQVSALRQRKGKRDSGSAHR